MDPDTIAQFCAITEADPQKAAQYLTVADGSLDTAIALYFESGGASLDGAGSSNVTNPAGGAREVVGGTDMSSAAASDSDMEAARRLQEEEYGGSGYSSGYNSGNEIVRERIERRTETLVDPYDNAFARRPVRRGPRARPGIFNQTSDFLAADSDDAEEDDAGSEDDSRPRLSNRQRRLAELFRPPFDIIDDISLDSAKSAGQMAKKWIMINIQEVSEFQCQVLNRDLWSNRQVKDAVKQHFVFLQYDATSVDGQEYRQFYPFESFPHVAILDPRTGEQMKVWSEVPSSGQFIEDLTEFLESYSLDSGKANANPLGRKSKKPVDHMTEEEQMNLALRQSLGVAIKDSESDDDILHDSDEEEDFENYAQSDSDVEMSGGDEVIVISDDEDDGDTKEPSRNDETNRVEDIVITDEDKFAMIIPQENEEPAHDATRIQFRLSSGKRLVRKFSVNDPVRKVYAFVKAAIPEVKDKYFQLTAVGKNLINLLDESIESAGLKNTSVLVEILDDN